MLRFSTFIRVFFQSFTETTTARWELGSVGDLQGLEMWQQSIFHHYCQICTIPGVLLPGISQGVYRYTIFPVTFSSRHGVNLACLWKPIQFQNKLARDRVSVTRRRVYRLNAASFLWVSSYGVSIQSTLFVCIKWCVFKMFHCHCS